MNDALMKFKEIVEKSQTVSVRVGETMDISKILGGATLHKLLEKLGKVSSFDINLSPKNIKNAAKILLNLREEELSRAPRAKENILVKFDAKILPVKELKYEKEGDLIKIILEGVSGELDTSELKIEKERVPVDLLLLIDPKESETEKFILQNPYKEVVKISARGKNLPLKIMELALLLLDEIPHGAAEALWFLVGEEVKLFHQISKENLEAMLELEKLNLDFGKIVMAREAIFGNSFLRLLGRALARSHYEKEISTTWSVLSKSDFEKTNESSNSTLGVLQNLRALNPCSKFYALLWAAEKENINALVASSDAEKLLGLSSLFATSPASSYFTINSFASFSEAEMKIREMIRKIIQ